MISTNVLNIVKYKLKSYCNKSIFIAVRNRYYAHHQPYEVHILAFIASHRPTHFSLFSTKQAEEVGESKPAKRV